MRRLWFLILILMVGCAGTMGVPTDDQLYNRVTVLEEQIKRLEIMSAAGAAAATDRVWPFYGLTGGGNDLIGIAEASIGANDFALGRDSSGYGYLYYWDATHSASCSPPACLRPDPTDNTGSWLSIVRWYAESFYSTASDGDHYIDASNSSSFPTPSDGAITARDDYDAAFLSDGSVPWIPLLTGNYGEYTVAGPTTIDDIYCWGGTVTNDGASGDITLALPSGTDLMEVTVACLDNDGDITVTGTIGDAGGNVVLDCSPSTSNPMSVTFKYEGASWVVIGDAGAPTY